MYKLYKDVTGSTSTVILIGENKNDLFIPLNVSDNTDYQEYLKWLAEGNEPLPADNNQ